ncbi:MAG: hypothetical protein NVS1B4_03300 [Gemmatimonadaceae bacterium]
MTVAEQVAIEAALAPWADTIKRRGGTGNDTLAANSLQIAARLVRLQGRQGTMTLTLPAVAGSPLTMNGVAVVAVSRTSPTPSYIHMLVGWDGLDPVALRVRHIVVVVVDAAGQASGTVTMPPSAVGSAARFLDVTVVPAAIRPATSGTVTVSGAEYGGSCPGRPDTPAASCEIGRASLAASLATAAGTLTAGSSAPLPAFRLTAR